MNEEITVKSQGSVTTTVADLIASVPAASSAGLIFGDRRVVDFFSVLASTLSRSAVGRAYPELGALGFFLRRASLRRYLSQSGNRSDVLRVPRGLTLHISPSNVTTMYVYSWAMSALAGNTNVVRLPSAVGRNNEVLLEAIGESIEQADPVVGATQRLISYPRDDNKTTAALSSACQVRVIWGGDETIRHIRHFPLQPGAKELTFPDRSSFSVLSARAWQASGATARATLVTRFCNDAYWYGQAACSSPLTIFWIGERRVAEEASTEFFQALAGEVRGRMSTLQASEAIEKAVLVHGLAAVGLISKAEFYGNEVVMLDVAPAGSTLDQWSGIGSFGRVCLPSLSQVSRAVKPRHQTVTHFGFSDDELRHFAQELGSLGVDRIVPVGQALNFDSVWDGCDLLCEFSRLRQLRF
ncbi:acyl-CoA reductase [Streptomyces silvisoli]|uniref:long-chain-fatty-acyl-CoA reductase n=1 Tax=Streptomyces silvisoli TaxID=3034235 RepID=A0ABT5ZKB9_9ACTN|nr:acyl-CoA reductase [Streptomyces silvisoli]MDF3290281.1 acyl-CoA reductase [Streptomyces silvisoli]